jgi:bifunctional enzyme CysN/CysC
MKDTILTPDAERMNIVIVGHVDHGKSTVIGRLLADNNSLPEGKLEAIKAFCLKNSRPFEYAFLLDALKDEQSQGITIDTARCFFNTQKRQYVIIDAPGHIEFLKNMITGASRAEAALLVIDAKEGVRENSKRHGFILSLLGIRQVAVLINKMDLVDYSEKVFNSIKKEYGAFLKRLNVEAVEFIPVCARDGENFIKPSGKTPWYSGSTVIERMDLFEKEKDRENKPFRMHVQDIYKFTAEGDERRIMAGTVETGEARPGDEVVFLPSGKKSRITAVESFNETQQPVLTAGQAKGFTVDTQIYIKRGELACLASQPMPEVGFAFKANIFWLGRKPMIYGKRYKLKIGAAREPVYLEKILNIIDAAEIEAEQDKKQIDRHDVAQCVFKTVKPIAYDLYADNQRTGRFVIVDDYEISGGGIITEAIRGEKSFADSHVEKREFSWQKGEIQASERALRFGQTPKLIVITGPDAAVTDTFSRLLEKRLFNDGKNAYYLGMPAIKGGLDSDMGGEFDRDEHVRRIGELARIITDTGAIFITTLTDADDFEIDEIRSLNRPSGIIIIDMGGNLKEADDLVQLAKDSTLDGAVNRVKAFLLEKNIILEYYL